MHKIRGFIFLLLVKTATVVSQANPSYTVISGSTQGISGTNFTTSVISFSNTDKPGQPSVLREKNTSARLYMKLDLGNDYVKQLSSWNFRAVVNLNYSFGGSSTLKTLTITSAEPEVLKTEDVLSYFTVSSNPFTLAVTSVSVDNGAPAYASLPAGLLKNYIEKNIRLTVQLVREYDVDVRLVNGLMPPISSLVNPVSISGRLVTFSWQPGNGVGAYPNYELQILKLNNRDITKAKDQNEIVGYVDWSNSLRVETQSHKTSINLTLGEGSGFYIWRVRPIGTYFEGGIANSENYGSWSYSVPTASPSLLLNKSNFNPINVSIPAIFYFKDPDENLNWIYNRVFTEGDYYNQADPSGVKASEGITYADGLLHVRQTQKYNNSENTNSVSQSYTDYSGRQALVTIPVPVGGNLSGYKTGFLKNQSGLLYTVKMFDEDAKLQDPDKVSEGITSAYRYYSPNQTTSTPDNKHVPGAEGYPFKRTLFKSDGSNRVEEESGVGRAHSLGTQSLGQGRTVKYEYGTPSDEELIRIFGDEAPLAKSIVKTVTTDQNNIKSVSYTSPDGKTIATCLLTYSTSNMAPPSGSATLLTVHNQVNENGGNGKKIVSSKRIVITENNTPVKLSYVNEPMPGTGAGCVTGNCNVRMRFLLVDLSTNVTYMSDADGSTTPSDYFLPTTGFAFPSGWKFKSINTGTTISVITPTGSGNNEMVLQSGSYLFVKELFSANSEHYADSLMKAENDKTLPIIEALMERMQEVNSSASHDAFMDYMATLKTMVDGYHATGSPNTAALLAYLEIDPNELDPAFQFPSAADFNLASVTTNTNDPATNDLSISSSCCGTMKVPFPKKNACYPCDGSPAAAYDNSNALSIATMTAANASAPTNTFTPYGIEDFKNNVNWGGLNDQQKRDAISGVVERDFIQPLKDRLAEGGKNPATDLWKVAPGFSYSSLKFMISNMLISRYYTGSAIQHTNGVWYVAEKDAAGNFSLTVPLSTYSATAPYNYPCKDLFNSWASAAELAGETIEDSGSDNVINQFNDNQGKSNSAQENGDDQDNWQIKLDLLKKYVKKKVSQEMDAYKDSQEGGVSEAVKEAATSLTSNFLTLAGCQYAAIIDGAALPAHINPTAGIYPADYLDMPLTVPVNAPGSGFYTTYTIGTGSTALTHSYVPYLFSSGTGSAQLEIFTCYTTTVNKLYYPYILKPEWMFKYFVYNVYENNASTSFIKDDNLVLPHQVLLDIQHRYNPPLSYLAGSVTVGSGGLCNPMPVSSFTTAGNSYSLSYTHVNWSAGERLSFYNTIKMAPKCYANKGVDASEPKNNYFDPPGQLPECASKQTLINAALVHLAEQEQGIYNQKGIIKEALFRELSSSCYTLVPCKNGPGQVTEKEVDIMVNTVITSATAQINAIRQSIQQITVVASNSVACTSPTNIISTYTDGLCNLPACSQVDCNEIIFYNDNSLGIVGSRNIIVKLFADCDDIVMNMLENGKFLPYIAPYSPDPHNPCPKALKEWRNGSCAEPTDCNGQHMQKTGCPTTQFKQYSKTYTVTATGN